MDMKEFRKILENTDDKLSVFTGKPFDELVFRLYDLIDIINEFLTEEEKYNF